MDCLTFREVVKTGLCASNRFGEVASLSGALDVSAICLENQLTEEKPLWTDIFGDALSVSGSDYAKSLYMVRY